MLAEQILANLSQPSRQGRLRIDTRFWSLFSSHVARSRVRDPLKVRQTFPNSPAPRQRRFSSFGGKRVVGQSIQSRPGSIFRYSGRTSKWSPVGAVNLAQLRHQVTFGILVRSKKGRPCSVLATIRRYLLGFQIVSLEIKRGPIRNVSIRTHSGLPSIPAAHRTSHGNHFIIPRFHVIQYLLGIFWIF